VTVQAHGSTVTQKSGIGIGGLASGGSAPDGWFSVGEAGPELVHKSASAVQVFSNRQSQAIVASTGMRAPGFAGGTNPGDIVTVSKSDQKHPPKQNKGPKGPGPTYTVAGQAYSSLRAAENAATRLFKADVQLGVKIDDKDLTSSARALGGTVAQAHAAGVPTIDADLAKLGASVTLRVNLRTANAAMDKVIADRNAKTDQLKNVMQEWAQVRDSVYQAGTGAFDASSAGTGYDGQQPVTFGSMQAQETQALNTVRAWSAGIRKLARLFGKSSTGRAMVQDLAEKGPGDLPEVNALVSAGPKDLTNFVSTQSQINSLSASLGRFIAATSCTARRSAGLQKAIEARRRDDRPDGLAHREGRGEGRQEARRPPDRDQGQRQGHCARRRVRHQEGGPVVAAISVPYLGRTGALRQLPSPNGPITASPSRQDSAKTLLSGGVAVIGRLNAKKTYSLPYSFLDAASADTLMGFYNRLYGYGPFVFVDPSVRNVIGLDVSTMGLRSAASHGWVASAGALAVATTGGPTGLDSGVLTWTSLVASATLQPGAVANTANTAAAPVYLPAEACSVSLWAKASSATTASLQLTGYSTAGAVNYTASATSMSLTTAWQLFTVSVAAGLAGLVSSGLVLPRVVLGGTVPTSVSIAAAQLEYGTAATAWQPGYGSPRVLPTATPGREVQQTLDVTTNHTFVLAEI
jgi:hypothetical protein